MKGKLFVALFAGIGVIVLGYYLFSHKHRVEHVGTAAKISIGSPLKESSSLIYLAKERGYFTENGLDADIKNYAFGLLAIKALLEGQIDMAIATDFAFVKTSFDNKNLRILCAIAESDVEEIIARKDSGISRKADLRGKKIGIKKGTSAEFHLALFSLFNGIPPRETDIIDLGPSRAVEAILKKQLDGVVLWPPYTELLKKDLGENAVSWSVQSGEPFFWLAITKQASVDKNQAVFERFLKSLGKASKFLKNNPEEAKKRIVKYLEPENAFAEVNWPKNIFTVGLPQALLLKMEDEARWVINNNSKNKAEFPNYLDFMLVDLFKKSIPDTTKIPY